MLTLCLWAFHRACRVLTAASLLSSEDGLWSQEPPLSLALSWKLGSLSESGLEGPLQGEGAWSSGSACRK